jgi:hypothetical protein
MMSSTLRPVSIRTLLSALETPQSEYLLPTSPWVAEGGVGGRVGRGLGPGGVGGRRREEEEKKGFQSKCNERRLQGFRF